MVSVEVLLYQHFSYSLRNCFGLTMLVHFLEMLLIPLFNTQTNKQKLLNARKLVIGRFHFAFCFVLFFTDRVKSFFTYMAKSNLPICELKIAGIFQY